MNTVQIALAAVGGIALIFVVLYLIVSRSK